MSPTATTDPTPADQGAYRGGQYQTMVRGSGFLAMIGGVAALAILPFYPPTAQIGLWGWAIVIPTTALSLITGIRGITLQNHPSMNALYLSSFTGIAQAGVLQWLAGGGKAPYVQLIMIPMFGAGSGQPPARCARVVVFAFAVALSPLLYGSIEVASTILEFTLLSVLTMMVSFVLASTRTHRAQLKDASEQANELAHVDQLTQLPNRRAFDVAIEVAIAAARDSGMSLSLLLCDVNSFKQINDTFGHAAGDEALQAIARAMSETVRRPDEAFRWAGDEFAVILRDTDQTSAARVAARLRDAVARTARRPDRRPISISTGVAELRELMTAEELLVGADQALFAHKGEREAA
jgi:diguanylate cyclase (GGDEF)-like protein